MTSTAPSSSSSADQVLVDFHRTDYRGFLFVVHDNHGLMLLHCTRKKSKGPHFQVPGGHVDEPEFLEAGTLASAKTCSDRSSQLELACKLGAARELYEETGLDLRSSLNRISPASLRAAPVQENGRKLLINEHKNRLFFFVPVNDQDFPPSGVMPMGSEGRHLRLKLSVEHSGFLFQPEPREAAEMLKQHSGGKVREALLMAMERDESTPSPANKKRGAEAAVVAATKASGTPMAKDDHNSLSGVSEAPSTRRRSKRDKDGTLSRSHVPVDLFPSPEKKGPFCCFC